jgi:hypothetical protein
MPRKSWPDFIASRPELHLVVLTLPNEPDEGPSARAVLEVFGRLIRRRMPEVDFGSAIIRQTEKEEVHFAFARESGARWLSDELHARRSQGYDGWASQATAIVTADEFLDVAATVPPKKYTNTSLGRRRFR